MKSIPSTVVLTQLQRIILLLSALALAILLILIRGAIESDSPLDKLARQSLLPEVALANGRPTVLEFYADWCEACKEMAPSMLNIEGQMSGKIDIVMLNVDNSRWQELIDLYEVNGIPKINFFDADGKLSGSSTGVRSEQELMLAIDALIYNKKLPIFLNYGKISELNFGAKSQ